MKRRKQFLLLLCIPLLLLLLTACHALFGVTATVTGLPEGTEPAFLVPDTDLSPDELRTASDNIKPRCTYHQDGWIALSMLRDHDDYYTQAGVLKAVNGGDSKDEAIAMCERFRTVRIAAVDTDGKAVAVSDEIPLYEEGKFYTVRDFTYDFESGSMEITEVYRRKWNGHTMGDWWFYSLIAAHIFGVIALIAILINALCNKKKSANVIEWVIIACAAVPFLFTTVLYLVINLHPDFTPNPAALDSGDILLLIVSNAMFLLLLGGVGTHRAVMHSKEKKQAQRNTA